MKAPYWYYHSKRLYTDACPMHELHSSLLKRKYILDWRRLAKTYCWRVSNDMRPTSSQKRIETNMRLHYADLKKDFPKFMKHVLYRWDAFKNFDIDHLKTIKKKSRMKTQRSRPGPEDQEEGEKKTWMDTTKPLPYLHQVCRSKKLNDWTKDCRNDFSREEKKPFWQIMSWKRRWQSGQNMRSQK